MTRIRINKYILMQLTCVFLLLQGTKQALANRKMRVCKASTQVSTLVRNIECQKLSKNILGTLETTGLAAICNLSQHLSQNQSAINLFVFVLKIVWQFIQSPS